MYLPPLQWPYPHFNVPVGMLVMKYAATDRNQPAVQLVKNGQQKVQ